MTRGLPRAITAAFLTLGLAAPTLALESISLSNGAELAQTAALEGETQCPPLTRIKYPFLSCSAGEGGGVVLNSLGQGGIERLRPEQTSFVEGNGYWGPDRPL